VDSEARCDPAHVPMSAVKAVFSNAARKDWPGRRSFSMKPDDCSARSCSDVRRIS
jgi:hypothetical protein